MPERYFLGELDRIWLENRAQWSGLSGPRKDGYFRLFNKNAAETIYVKPIKQPATHYGWIVELDGERPEYFHNILKTEAEFHCG